MTRFRNKEARISYGAEQVYNCYLLVGELVEEAILKNDYATFGRKGGADAGEMYVSIFRLYVNTSSLKASRPPVRALEYLYLNTYITVLNRLIN
jgi:hypothetical protein